LFGHEVGDHVGRRSEGGGNIAQLDMLAAEVDAHVDVARIWFVGGVKCHGTAMVMTPLLSQKSVVGRDLMDKSSPPRGWDDCTFGADLRVCGLWVRSRSLAANHAGGPG
jgi:hypothetical protein